MTFLLDANVLIALIDPTHISHDAAHAWFARMGQQSWATCPTTENGVIRIVGNSKYPNTPGSPAVVAEVVRQFRQSPSHVFWTDSVSLLDANHADTSEVLTAKQVTDSYLLALAVAHKVKLATFDRRLSTKAVIGGKNALHLIAAD